MQVEAAEGAKKQMVLINPQLTDRPSHSGIMGIRGREGRLQLADSFRAAYHFRLLYFSGFFYPIMGALRFEYGGKWQVRGALTPRAPRDACSTCIAVAAALCTCGRCALFHTDAIGEARYVQVSVLVTHKL